MMMNPELAKLLGQGQAAPASVAGTPVVNALRKMMGAGGSAPQMNDQGGPQPSAQPQQSRPMTEQDMDKTQDDEEAEGPMSTEEELDMARNNMGKSPDEKRASDIVDRMSRGEQVSQDEEDHAHSNYKWEGDRKPTKRDEAYRDAFPTDSDSTIYASKYGLEGKGRYPYKGASIGDRFNKNRRSGEPNNEDIRTDTERSDDY